MFYNTWGALVEKKNKLKFDFSHFAIVLLCPRDDDGGQAEKFMHPNFLPTVKKKKEEAWEMVKIVR